MLSVAADKCRLMLYNLDLSPVGATPATVQRIQPLRYDALPCASRRPIAHGSVVELLTITDNQFANADDRRSHSAHNAFEPCSPFSKRHATYVFTVLAQKVERDIGCGNLPTRRSHVLRPEEIQAGRECRKAKQLTARAKSHDLAIEDDPRWASRGLERLDELRKLARLVMTEPRTYMDLCDASSPFNMRECAHAVVLRLVCPVRMRERCVRAVREFREHRLHGQVPDVRGITRRATC